jgi:phosphoribosylamine--glycine ligase
VQDKKGQLATGGGRVLGIGSLADGAEPARAKSYAALENIKWRGMHFRHDIGMVAS